MMRSRYSTALNLIKAGKTPNVDDFEMYFDRNAKGLLDDLLHMKMIEIVGNDIVLTPIGFNSLSIEMRT
jgi:hypothetical protein